MTYTKKANRLVAIIHKTFQHFDKVTLINLYKTFVRPVIEYGNVIWGPRSAGSRENAKKSNAYYHSFNTFN